MERGYVNIDREDIQMLVREPSPAARSRVAEKICMGFNSGQFTESEIKVATEIFRLLLRDTDAKVRRVLSDQLKDNLKAPHDIIMSLAQDKAEVALPVLQYSYVLTEEDLIAIVKATREIPKLRAIAMRESISAPLSSTIIEKNNIEVAQLLIGNKSAQISETSLERVLEQFSGEHDLLEELVYRGGLPYAYAERLFYQVSGSLKKQLTKKYRLNKNVVDDAVESARETTVLQFLSPWMSQQDITNLVMQMDKSKRLTDSVIIRSLCIGDIRFFETSIARRVGIAVSNAKILVADPGPLGFKALYVSARLPEEYYECVRTLLGLAQEETSYGNYQTQDYCMKMMGRISSGGYDKTVKHMDTFLMLIGQGMYDRRILN